MFRVRYDDQGRELNLAPLNVLKKDLTLTWVSSQGHLVLFADAGNKALLRRALEELPLVRLSEVKFDVTELGEAVPITFSEFPPHQAHSLALALWRGAVRLTWRDGLMSCEVFTETPEQFLEMLETWPDTKAVTGWRGKLKALFAEQGVEIAPGRLALPDVETYPTLASRNKELLGMSTPPSQGLPFAVQEADGQMVHLIEPVEAVWVGFTPSVPSTLQRLIGEWLSVEGRRVIVMDRRGWSVNWETDRTVSWVHPGQGQRINPLAPLNVRDADDYADLVMEWLTTALGVTEAMVGKSTYRFMRLILKIWGHSSVNDESNFLSPPIISSLLGKPALTEQIPYLPPLTEEEKMMWDTRNWTSVEANLMPVAARLKSLLDQPQMSVLWFPPFTDALDFESMSVLAPGSSKMLKAFAASCWLPLRHTLSPSTLVVGLGVGDLGQKILAEAKERGGSVLLWGETVQEAAGAGVDLDQVDLLVSRSSDAPMLVGPLKDAVSFQHILAQDDDQVILRTADGVAALSLRMQARVEPVMTTPQPQGGVEPVTTVPQPQGGDGHPDSPADPRQAEGATLPTPQVVPWSALTGPLVVIGPQERAFGLFKALAGRCLRDGAEPLVLSGNGSTPAPTGLSEQELPAINPLYPRSLSRWLWWAGGVGLTEELMRRGWAAGAQGLRDLAEIAYRPDQVRLAQIHQTGYFDDRVKDAPLKGSAAVRSHEPAATYALVADSLEAGRRVFLWYPQVALSKAVLERLQAVVYQPGMDVDGLPLLILGDSPFVSEELGPQAARLQKGEALWIRPDGTMLHVKNS